MQRFHIRPRATAGMFDNWDFDPSHGSLWGGAQQGINVVGGAVGGVIGGIGGTFVGGPGAGTAAGAAAGAGVGSQLSEGLRQGGANLMSWLFNTDQTLTIPGAIPGAPPPPADPNVGTQSGAGPGSPAIIPGVPNIVLVAAGGFAGWYFFIRKPRRA